MSDRLYTSIESHDDSENLCRTEILFSNDDRRVGSIGGLKSDKVFLGLKILHRRFVPDEHNDNFIPLRMQLFSDEEGVPFLNSGVDHGIAANTKCEDVAMSTDERTIDRNDFLDILFSGDRLTCGNPTDSILFLKGMNSCDIRSSIGLMSNFGFFRNPMSSSSGQLPAARPIP